MYKAKINITLRKSILDPKGKAARHALHNLGLNNAKDVRIGKFVEMDIEADNDKNAYKVADEACSKLLANEVMEDYQIQIEKV